MVERVRQGFLYILIAAFISGCSGTTDFFTGMFWDDEDVSTYTEPNPGRSVGLDELWDSSLEGEPDEYMTHPRQIAVTDDSIYVGTFEGHVHRIAMDSGDEVWENGIGPTIAGGVAIDDKRVFAGTVDGRMMALSRADGAILWQAPVSTSVASAPLVADGKVIFTTLNNRTYALDVETGKRVWTHSSVPMALVVKGAATPSTDGSVVYVGYSTGEVFALKLKTGDVLWGNNFSRLAGRNALDRLQDVDAEIVIGAPDMTDRTPKIYSVNHQGSVMALHPGSGLQIWKRKFSAVRRPLLWGRHLYVSDVEGNVVSLSVVDGMEIWRTQVSDGTLSAPVRLGKWLVVGDDKGRIMSLDPASGRVVGLDKLGDPIVSDPVVKGDSLIIWTNDGELIRYRAEDM